VVAAAITGASGIFQALAPEKSTAKGTCRLVAVIPFIMACVARPLEAT
jgi:hypothetical protein